uniref:NADH dehydrogenase [ubiquinone] 1 alpha subcomplex subunit 3 n=1 Tax=Cyprinus carpio carpio TaxID=630221 RepID=A0A9J8BDG0_CYPCA
MAAIGRFVKNAWNKEPVITVSCGIGLLGEGDINAHYSSQYASSSSCCMNLRSVCVVFSACALPALSPLTKYTGMMNQAVPYNYPVPVRDDGNMPDVPAHPCDPQGRNLDWLKNL